jgi:hypothetical protein
MRAWLAVAALLATAELHAQTANMLSEATAMPTGGALWGSDISIENRPCCESAGRASDLEAPVLAALAGRANRQWRTLRLRLDTGRTMRIVDCPDVATCDVQNVRLHRLVGWWPARGYYIVAVDGFAEQMAYLIRARDGLVVRTLAPPVLSPDERHAIATDLMVSRGAGATAVLDMSVDPPAQMPFRKSATCPALLAAGSLPHWVDDKNAQFSDPMVPADEPRPKELSLRIESGTVEWVCKY